MPRTAAKVEDFRALLPAGTRVYIAHIDGTEIDDMVATARRLRDEGFEPMPHFPARSIPGPATLADWIAATRARPGVTRACCWPAASPRRAANTTPRCSFWKPAFRRRGLHPHLHVAGHPEGNRDIDPDGGDARSWRRCAGNRISPTAPTRRDSPSPRNSPSRPRCHRLGRAAGGRGHRDAGPSGRRGPAKLQTLIKFAIACGVGKSLGVLQKRAKDVTKLLLPFEPTEFMADLAARKAAGPAIRISSASTSSRSAGSRPMPNGR
jgi:methylenetetrahydrofolate reductase (NADPH)